MRSPFGLKEKDKILINAVKSCQHSLDLRGQHLTAIPCCVSQKPLLLSLQSIELSYNELTEVPKELGLLLNLQELYLQHNKIESLPKDLGSLLQLRKLGLAHNRVNDVPFFFKTFTRLEWLNLSGNFIEVIPPFLLCLPRLQHLYVLCNPVENIPRDIYVQSLAVIREYFHISVNDVTLEVPPVASMDCNANDIVTTIQSLRKAKVVRKLFGGSKHQGDCKLTEDLKPAELMEQKPTQLQQDSEVNNDLTDTKELSATLNLPKSVNYRVRHTETVEGVVKSQKEQLQLVKDLREKVRLSQEIRKLNLEFLKQQSLRRNSRFIHRPRRMSDLSLDSGLRERHRRRMVTSEYGSLSTFTADTLPVAQYDSDDDGSIASLESEASMNCSASSADDLSDICELEDSSGKRHITHGDICVIIPECNLSGHLKSEFYLEIIEDLAYHPPMKGREVVASEVLMMEPHGALFYGSDPAIISLPFDVKLMSGDQVICLCSDTGIGEKPHWLRMDKIQYKVFESHVEINAVHFSLFAIVVQKGYPCAQRFIRKGVGGCLFIPEVPGVEVNFPETSLLYDIEASVKVLYADEPYDVDHSDPSAFALAAPVVELGPHGCQFNPSTTDHVTVRLPLPNGKEIIEKFGDRHLTFWCSSTTADEPLLWQQFHPKSIYIDTEDVTLCSVYFSVEHFTFFRVLWDVVDAILYEAKLGASHFVPIFQFYVSCQSLMSDSEDGVRFGLCVACSRFGKPLEGIGNFPIPVGSHPPKMITTGPLSISIISGLFKADGAAGQKDLVHTETFTGRQIVVQFICCFTGEIPPHGSFGKVEIEQPNTDGSGTMRSLFSFNLDKPRDAVQYQNSHAWDVQLSRELAALLTISTERDMGDEVWEEIAKALRYTQAEITRIAASDDPMTELLANYKRRGGQPHEYISAMYSIGQYRNGSRHARPTGTAMSSIAEEEKGESSNMEPKMCPCVKKNMRKRKLPEISWEDKFFEITEKLLGKWKDLGRVLKMNESMIQEIEKDYKQDGVREQAYQLLIAWREKYPDRCSLNTLSTALCKIGLGYVAKQCCLVEMG